MNKNLTKTWRYSRLADDDLNDNHENFNQDLTTICSNAKKKKENEEDAKLLVSLIDEDTSQINWKKQDNLFTSYQSDFELKQRNSEKCLPLKKRAKFEDYIIYQIQKDDTLQKISLKCYCTINDIKRLNNLVSDQDFYALRYIKIPIVKYGILSKVLVHQVNQNNDEKHLFSPSSSSSTLIINVGLKKTFQYDDNNQDMKKFLTNLDKDLEEIRKATDNYTQMFIETGTQSLAQAQSPVRKSAFYFDGADCGLHWLNMLIIALIIFVLLPVIYVFVISNHSSE